MKLLSRLTISASRLTARSLFVLSCTFLYLFVLSPVLSPKPALAVTGCTSYDGDECRNRASRGYGLKCDGPTESCCSDQPACDAYIQSRYLRTDSWYRKSPPQLEAEKASSPETEVNAPKFAASQLNYTIGELVGQTALGSNSLTSNLGTAIAFMTVNRPASTGSYVHYLASRSGFVEPAYAANERGGFDLLKPIQAIWIATRNIAYLITSLILVVIGFMIMLRKKIDAQTVIGVQQALPKLVITLLLITFSYAIAGFVIDMIYFLIFLAARTAITFEIYQPDAGVLEILTTKNVLSIVISDLWWAQEGVNQVSDAVGQLIANLVGDVSGGAAISVADILSQPVAWVIITVAVLFAGFKLFFSLLMAYIQIIVSVIVGPIQLMLNALPGSDAFSKWFRNLLANAMAFPAAAIMFLFGAAMMGLQKGWGVDPNIGFKADTIEGGFMPPLLGGFGSVNEIQGLIGLGIILMTPKVVDMVKEWVQAPEFKYGSAIGEAVGFGWGGAKWTADKGVGTPWRYREAGQAEGQARAQHEAQESYRRAVTEAAGKVYTGVDFTPKHKTRGGRLLEALRGGR